MGNPEDVVEVRGDLVVDAVSKTVKYGLQERVDWWLEEADDECVIHIPLSLSTVHVTPQHTLTGTV